MEFKGKFESDKAEEQKNLIHMGCLEKIGSDEYRLEIGVMDLIGKTTKIDDHLLYTETIDSKNPNEKILMVKGVITKKILFEKRPIPNMLRADMQPSKN
jgi:hypothetical protein